MSAATVIAVAADHRGSRHGRGRGRGSSSGHGFGRGRCVLAVAVVALAPAAFLTFVGNPASGRHAGLVSTEVRPVLVHQPPSRRGALLAALSWSPLLLGGGEGPADAAEQQGIAILAANPRAAASPGAAAEDEEDCRCCTRDWCGCDDCFDCYDFLRSRSFDLPSTAAEAFTANGGGSAPSSAADWRLAFGMLPGAAGGVAAEKFKVGKSTLPNAGEGAFAQIDLPAGAVLPPYRGRVLNFAEADKLGPYVWCPAAAAEAFLFAEQYGGLEELANETSYCVDSDKAVEANPARYVNGAGTREQCKAVNVEICQLGEVGYFRTTRPVQRGSELVADYGKFFLSNSDPC